MFTTTPYVMFSGFFLYYRDTPKVFQWMYETSVVRHAIEAVSVAIFGYGRKPLYCDMVIIFFMLFSFHRDLKAKRPIQYNIVSSYSKTIFSNSSPKPSCSSRTSNYSKSRYCYSLLCKQICQTALKSPEH